MRPFAAVTLLFAALACSGIGDSKDAKTKILPVEDPFAKDTTPPPPPPRVEHLSIMDSLPYGGFCNVTNYRRNADLLREVRYEVTSPRRTFVLEIGKPPRKFPPVSLEISGTLETPGQVENEQVYVAFKETGGVMIGTRRFVATGRENTNDRGPLLMADSAQALAFAAKILEICER